MKRWLEQAEPGLLDEIYLDVDPKTGIQTGAKWTEALWRVNARCEAVICLLSRSWANSKECHAEYRQAEGMHKPIFCARIEDFPDEDITLAWQRCDLFGAGPVIEVDLDDGGLPVRLSDDGLQRLLAGLRAVGIGADSFAWPPPGDPDRSPYRGWQPLESVDAAVYFGRDAQIVRALDELREMRDAGPERMFVVLGPSGVGKSSFLRAGLLPRLRRDDRRFLPMTPVRPGRHALTGETGLARSIHDLRKEVGLAGPSLGEIKNAMGDAAVRAWLAEAVAAARTKWLDATASTPPPTLVLPVDQAEELFGVDAADEGQALLDLLGRLLSDPDPAVPHPIVVATIRSDRYESLQTAPQLATVQTRLFDRLKAMPQAQFIEVMCGPARRAAESDHGFTLAPDLVDSLVQDASAGADTLPLLALTLSRLYEDYAGSREPITVQHYEAMGGMRRVVQNEVDSLLSADPAARAEQLQRLHDAFIPWLATVNCDTDQPMRRIARWAELPEESHSLLDAFVGRRLLVKGERDGQVVVEVALESLLRQWDELAQWLRDEYTDLRDADAVERAAIAWERSGRHDDWLFDGERLSGAESLSGQTGFAALLQPAGEFLRASRHKVNRKLEEDKSAAEAHARSLRRRSQVLAALLAVIAVVAAFAVISQQHAGSAEKHARLAERNATAAKLAGQARAMLGDARPGGDRRAILQMAAAEELAPRSDPESLLNTLSDTRRLVRILTLPTPVSGMDVSPDGRQVAAAGEDGVIRQWDLATGRPVGEPLKGPPEKAGAMYVRDGSWIASSTQGGAIHMWNAKTAAPVHVQNAPAGDFLTATISPDGASRAVGYRDGKIQLFDVATGTPKSAPIPAHNQVFTLAFSPDGSQLASGGADGTVRLWNVRTGQLNAGPPLPSHRGPVVDVEFSPDGSRIASLSYLVDTGVSGQTTDGMQLRTTDASSGRPVVDGVTDFGYGVNDLAFSPDGQNIAIGASDGTVRVRDANTGAAVGLPLRGHTGAVIRVAYSVDPTDGTHIVSAGDTSIHVWSAGPDRAIGDWLPGLAAAGSLPVAVSADGHTVATRDVDNESDIALWQTDTRERIRTIETGHAGPVSALAWRSDGEVIASAGGADHTVRLWDAQTGAAVGPALSGPPAPTIGLWFSPDGHRVAANVSGSDPRLWDLTADPPRATVLPVNGDAVSTIGFSGDGRRLIIASPMHFVTDDDTVDDKIERTGNVFDAPEATSSAIRVWDAGTGQLAGTPLIHAGGRPMDIINQDGDGPYFAGAISPDGQHLVVATGKGLRLYDVSTGKPVGEPWINAPAADSSIVALAFDPDGHYVVSCDTRTSQLQLWDAQTGRPVGNPLTGAGPLIYSLSFSVDGSHIVSRGDEGWMLWPGPNRWRDELCDKVTTTMSRAEWDAWVSPDIGYQDPCPKSDQPG